MPREVLARFASPQSDFSRGPWVLAVDGPWALDPGFSSRPPVYAPAVSAEPLLPVGNLLPIGTEPRLAVEWVSVAANPSVDQLKAQLLQGIPFEVSLLVDEDTNVILTGELRLPTPASLARQPAAQKIDAGAGVSITINVTRNDADPGALANLVVWRHLATSEGIDARKREYAQGRLDALAERGAA